MKGEKKPNAQQSLQSSMMINNLNIHNIVFPGNSWQNSDMGIDLLLFVEGWVYRAYTTFIHDINQAQLSNDTAQNISGKTESKW